MGRFVGAARLEVMAHLDVEGPVAPHVGRTPASRERLTQRADLVGRDNFGYDSMSCKTGLDRRGDTTPSVKR